MQHQTIEPAIFSTVEVNRQGPSACMPAEPADPAWTGIIINAPDSVQPTANHPAVVPVCAFAVLPFIIPSPPPLRLIAIDRNTGVRYQGNAFSPSPPNPPDDSLPNPIKRPPLTQQDVEGMTGEMMFTTDLVSAVGIPRTGGTFDVHIERGALVSNRRTIVIGPAP